MRFPDLILDIASGNWTTKIGFPELEPWRPWFVPFSRSSRKMRSATDTAMLCIFVGLGLAAATSNKTCDVGAIYFPD